MQIAVKLGPGRRKREYIVRDIGDKLEFQPVPTKAEVVKTLGYDPGRLAEVMRSLWRCE